MKTPELLDIIVKFSPLAIKFVPDHLVTPNLIKIALLCTGRALFMQNDSPDDLIEKRLEYWGRTHIIIPKYWLTYDVITFVISKRYDMAIFIPHDLLTKEIILFAIKQSRYSIQYIPEHLVTECIRDFHEQLWG